MLETEAVKKTQDWEMTNAKLEPTCLRSGLLSRVEYR